MEEEEVPEYFICPISLQIMNDPVTLSSGITYDRLSIEHWLLSHPFCPVTKHPLSLLPLPLTPNHTLRRLIHSWYGAPSPSPSPPLTRFYIAALVRSLDATHPHLPTLRKLHSAALDCGSNRAYMVDAGVADKLMHFVVACRRAGDSDGLPEALGILYAIRSSLHATDDFVDSLMWVLDGDVTDDVVKSHAAHALKAVVMAHRGVLERLSPEFFVSAARVVRGGGGSWRRAVLCVLLEACSWGRNREVMVASGTVVEMVEVELRWSSEKKTTAVVLGIVYQLCLCAEGRAQLLSHAAGMAVVTRRMLEDERAVLIVWQIAKYAATKGVVEEMMRLGTVANLCLVMVADTAAYVKDKARKILRMHFHAWKDSPCIQMDTLTGYSI